MFKHKHYVPILKGKRAEFPALGKVKHHERITPLFEAVPNRDANQTPKDLASCGYPKAQPYFIDMVFFDDEDDSDASPKKASKDHPMLVCFEESKKRGQVAIPVTGIGRSPAYQDAVRQIVQKQKHGVAVRLAPDDFEDEEDLSAAIGNLFQFLDIDYSDADLVIDLGSVAHQNAQIVAQIHRANLDLTPHINDWRTLTVSSAAFPDGLAGLTRGKWNPITRNDWQGWERLVSSGSKKPKRLPAYSDYGIANPFLPPTGRVTILAQLRYSSQLSFMVWKGDNVTKVGHGQFIDICKDLTGRAFYRGASFSDGDQEIQWKATNGGAPGNPEQWRKIGNNHHFETVLDQLANLP